MTANILLNMTRRFGHSNPRSRQAVIKAHDGEANARAAARTWAELYHVHGDGDEVWLAYISLVDLGYRIGCYGPKTSPQEAEVRPSASYHPPTADAGKSEGSVPPKENPPFLVRKEQRWK